MTFRTVVSSFVVGSPALVLAIIAGMRVQPPVIQARAPNVPSCLKRGRAFVAEKSTKSDAEKLILE
ncbi:hypothetical protein PhCBS80983_g03196 [Powellomyces hirtus]|uniref:Uncharacterized protein n=1 Tax=Powellomyces hirtus TaxID=109895 RepID=A0A507E5M2_9FUNG|nr:hypothetical protein PhCBS80983_g03196 [Powellomyces hirtus]